MLTPMAPTPVTRGGPLGRAWAAVERRSPLPPHLLLLAGIVLAGILLRWPTLDLQSFRHDEAVTAGRVLRNSFFDTMSVVPRSESTPPLYYALAWLWAIPFGHGEVGLRSLSALAGTATIPVVYLAGARLISCRIGLVAAALVACSPVLVWFSQDARAYALAVLLSTLSLLFFVTAMRNPGRRPLAGWAACSALAITTHYFTAFLIAPEVVILLWVAVPRRAAVLAVAAVLLAGAALLPLAIHQANSSRNDWVSGQPLGQRIERTAVKFAGDDTGDEHGVRQPGPLPLLIPALLTLAGPALLLARGGGRERQGAALAFALGGIALALPLLLAPLGSDYFLGRNLLPAFIPLTLVVAAGFGARRAGGLGIGAAGALCLAMIAFVVEMNRAPRLQREDLRAAAEAIGPPRGPRAVVTVNYFADEPLAYYLGARKVGGGVGPLREIDVVGYGTPSAALVRQLDHGFKVVEKRPVTYNFTLTRLRSSRAAEVPFARLSDGQLVGTAGRAAVLTGGESGG
jgi:mannosyltransferase